MLFWNKSDLPVQAIVESNVGAVGRFHLLNFFWLVPATAVSRLKLLLTGLKSRMSMAANSWGRRGSVRSAQGQQPPVRWWSTCTLNLVWHLQDWRVWSTASLNSKNKKTIQYIKKVYGESQWTQAENIFAIRSRRSDFKLWWTWDYSRRHYNAVSQEIYFPKNTQFYVNLIQLCTIMSVFRRLLALYTRTAFDLLEILTNYSHI